MTVSKYEGKGGKEFWQVKFNFTDKQTGKAERIQKRGFVTKKDAQDHEAELRRMHVNNGVLKPSRMTVAEHCEEWLNLVAVSLEETTKQKYRQSLNAYISPVLGSIALKDLRHEQVQKFVTELKRVGGGYGGAKRKGEDLALKSKKDIHGILHKALAKAVQQGRIQHNPADYIVFSKRVVKEKSAYTEKEISRIVKACESDDRWFGIIRLLFFTTVRRGELLGLKWDCVNLEQGSIHIFNTRVNVSGVKVIEKAPKSLAGIRNQSIDRETVEALKRLKTLQEVESIALGAEWKGGDLATCYVCTKKNGSPMGTGQPSRRLKALAKAAGVRVLSLHESRHTAITNGERYLSPSSNQRRAGHSSPRMTAHYTHHHDGHDKEGVEQYANSVKRHMDSNE